MIISSENQIANQNMLGQMPDIELEKYNGDWPIIYLNEKCLIYGTVGRFVDEVVHIGSTAISGIPAKPTIDICVGVKSLDILNSYMIKPLREIGYEYIPSKEEDVLEHRFLQKLNDAGKHLYHMYVVVTNGRLWQEYIKFRDYMTANPAEKIAYQNVKLELQSKYSDNREKYTDGKTGYIKSILEKALATPHVDS